MRIVSEIAGEIAAVTQRIADIEVGPRLATAEFERLVGTTLNEARESSPPAGPISRSTVDRYIAESAAASGIDPALLAAMISNESGFNPYATSGAGARGLMQLMPQTAASLGVTDAYDPEQNVRAGARYLRALLDRFGTLQLAVAAYNAGPAAVERYGGIPPYVETRAYVRDVLARYRELGRKAPVSVRKSVSWR
jgi:soluble lytic murein transglycosylase-like protein